MTNQTETALTVLEKDRATFVQLALAYMPNDATEMDAQKKITREIFNIQQQVRNNPALQECAKDSFVYALRQSIMDGLSLSPSAGLAQLFPGTVKTGKDEQGRDKYEKVAQYKPTGDGYISIARQAGQLIDHKTPVPTFNEVGQVETVVFEFLVPSGTGTRWETFTADRTLFNRLRKKSHDKNARNKPDANYETMNYANPNYTSHNGWIDPGFAATKTVVHGLKRRGVNKEEAVQYGGEAAASVMTAPIQQTHTEEATYTEVPMRDIKEVRSELGNPVINPVNEDLV